MNLSDGSRIHPDDLVLENRTLVEEAASWDKFNEWVQDLSGQWCFRGQQEASWLLTTKLDRDIRVEYQSKFRSGIFHIERREEEAALVCAFKQIAPEYICQLPAEDDLASWLSLLQHYGAPTRLLDWTYSPHIAAFFAMENESMLDGFSSIFAFDLAWLQRSLESYGLGSISTSDALRREQTLAVVRIHPAVPNERMRAQKGLFLGKLFDKAPFYVVLASMMMHSPSRWMR